MLRRDALRWLISAGVVLGLMVVLSLVLGMAGPLQVLPGYRVQAQDASIQSVVVSGAVITAGVNNTDTIRFAYTPGTGTDRLMLVGVSWSGEGTTPEFARTIAGVTFGGTPLTAVGTSYNAYNRRVAIYSLKEPLGSIAATVAITFTGPVTGNVYAVAGALTFAGVDQTSPLGPFFANQGNSATAAVTVTGLAGDELVFDTAAHNNQQTSFTPASGQTARWNVNQDAGSNAGIRGAASTKPAGSSLVTTTWTCSGSSTWAIGAVAIFPTCTLRYNLTVGNDTNGTVSLTPAGGSYCSGRTVVLTPVPNSGRIFSGWVGANASDIVNTAGVYTIVMNGNKSVTANFAPQSCADVSLTAEDDTYLSANATTTNYGSSTTLEVDRSTGTSRRTALLRWNVSSIPSMAVVNSASIVISVTNTSTYSYPLYALMRNWVENQATWSIYSTGNSWTEAGAARTWGDPDRADVNLWNSTNTSFNTLGSRTVALNADGVALVQGWVAGGTNNGVIIQDYNGTSDNLILQSVESTWEPSQPKLTINRCLPNNTAPAQPELVKPLDGATNVIVPSLMITATDPDSNVMNVTFYGQVAGSMQASAQAFSVIGTSAGVASGNRAYMLWNGLAADTTYQWYAVLWDGNISTQGPTWTFTTGTPTVAEITSLTAEPALGRIHVAWDASEAGILGFHVWRASSVDGARDCLTASLIPSQAPGSASGGHYQFVDEAVQPGLTYYYWVERVALDGGTDLHGPIHATASWGLKPPPARE